MRGGKARSPGDKPNIAQRIAAVMGEVDYVQKEKKQGMNYSIVSHDAVTAKVRPLLHKHGVIYYPRGLQVQQNGNRTEAVFMVRFENIDERTTSSTWRRSATAWIRRTRVRARRSATASNMRC
jgi:hypothetical protein